MKLLAQNFKTSHIQIITCQTLLAKELRERPRVAVRTHLPGAALHFHCIMTKLLTLGLAEASMAVFHLAVLT